MTSFKRQGTDTAAVADAVTNGLRSMITELGKLSDTLVDVRKEQVQNYKAEKLRNELLTTEITKIWKTPLRELEKHIRSSAKSTAADTKATTDHTKGVLDNNKALFTSAAQSLKIIAARELEEQSIRDAERIKKLSNRQLSAEVITRSASVKQHNKELLHASSVLKQISTEIGQVEAAGGKASDEQAERHKAASIAYDKQLATTNNVSKGLDLYKNALTGHVSVLKGATGALKQFFNGLAIGVATRKLYDEAQSAKVTGNYANSTDFMGGQFDAATMGLGTQAFNEITASARAASLTTASIGEFNDVLKQSTDSLQTITTSREEGARLSAQVLQGAATAGISAKVAATQMDALATNAMKLSKITGQSATDMMKLSVAITEDRDHRETMLGLNEAERINYVKKQSQDLLQYKLQGYSLEQAQELQKIAMQTRAQGIAERIGNQAKIRASGNILASMYTGPAAVAMQDNLRQQEMLDAKGRAGGLTGRQRDELEKQKKANSAEFVRLEAIAYQNSTLSEVQSGMRATFLKDQTTASGVDASLARSETAANQKTLANKVDEKGQGEKGSPLDIATTLAGYSTALKENSIALLALTVAFGAYTLLKGGLGIAEFASSGKARAVRVLGKRAARKGMAALGAPRVSSGSLVTAPTAGIVPITASAAETIARSKGFMAGIPATSSTAVAATGGLAKLSRGPVGLLASLGLDYAADKAGGYNTATGTGLNLASNVAGGASTGAMLGSFVPGLGTVVGGIAGGIAGAGATAYNYYNSPSAKLARQEQAAKEKVEKESAEQQKKQAEMAKDGGIRTSSTEDLQREFFMLAIQFYRNADPLADKASRDKHAQALHRLATNSGLDIASFAGTPSLTGG